MVMDFKYYRLASTMLIVFLLMGCKNKLEDSNVKESGVEIEDKYAEFKVKPSYITNPDPEQKAYFEAYDKTLQKWGVPYEELYIPTSKGIAHVLLSGPKNGIPVVLLHGMNASSTMWYPNAKALAQEYQIFAIDLIIEPGKSYKTVDLESVEDIIAWYQELFMTLELDPFHLVGTSRGGWLAMNLALEGKRDIRSLTLLAPAQTFVWIPPSTDLLKNMLNIFYSKEESIERTMETMSQDTSKIDADYLDQYHIAKDNDSLNKFLPSMKPFSNRELNALKMPVLVLIGDDDVFNTERTIHLAEKHIPNVKGEIIPDSGHFITIDQAEIVNRKVLGFLKNVDTEAGMDP